MTPYFASSDVTIYCADSRTAWEHLPEHSADAIVTSPPYFGLRDYGHDGQLGLEPSPDEYITDLADLLTGYGERVLKPEGSLWLNLGDTYSSTTKGSGGSDSHGIASVGMQHYDEPRRIAPDFPSKCLLMIPERVALALIARGWILRNRVVWAKPNGMPSSVTDRLATKHEALFHLVRQPRYFYDLDAIREPPAESRNEVKGQRKYASLQGGRNSINEHGWTPGPVNPGDVWTVPTQPFTWKGGSVRLVRVEADAVDGDTRRIASADCPVHAGPGRPDASASDGGRADAPSCRTERTDVRHVPAQSPGFVPTGPLHEPGCEASSSGSHCPSCGGTAIARSSRTRRTDLDPATSPPCTPSAGTPDGTPRSGGSHDGDERGSSSVGSNSGLASSDGRPSARTGSGTGRMSSCRCTLYREERRELDHFAVFPPELVRRPILATVPEGGTVLDPFFGSGTTGVMARRLGRKAVGVELSETYCELAAKRFQQEVFDFGGAS